MDYYVPSYPPSPMQGWWEAVNSEFFYEQEQIQNMNANYKSSINADMYNTTPLVPVQQYSNSVAAEQTMATFSCENSNGSVTYPSNNIVDNQQQQQQQQSQDQLDMQLFPQQVSSINPFYTPMSSDGNIVINDTDAPMIPTYPPCQGPRPWNFAQCYGFYGEPACPLLNLVDMEDFM